MKKNLIFISSLFLLLACDKKIKSIKEVYKEFLEICITFFENELKRFEKEVSLGLWDGYKDIHKSRKLAEVFNKKIGEIKDEKTIIFLIMVN